ncbi:MAG: hypothetical protein ABJD07_00090 [Gemmatimonadaceae bacterium]
MRHPTAYCVLRASAAMTILAVRLAAQSVESRILSAPDGVVRLTYATHAGVCGDAKNTVAMGHVLYIYPSMESYGRWSGVQCVPGPARIELTMSGHQLSAARTRVGGSWGAASSGDVVTDLGTVPANEAAQAMLALAGRAELPRTARETMLAAAIADSATVAPGFLRLARDGDRPRDTRRRAVFWYGVTGGPAAVPNLAAMAKAGDADRSLREAAVSALAQMPDGAGVTTLIEIANGADDVSLRGKAAFWLGQADDPRARKALHTMIEADATPEKVKSEAIFALSQGDPTSDDVAFLESSYKRFTSETLKDRVFFSLSQTHDDKAMRWLLSVGADERETVKARNQALFWAGQSGVPLADLARTYDATTEPKVKDHLIFVLSQRSESAAVDKLMAIARTDANREMRKKALFWLGQKDDPRVTKMLTDLISR